MALLTDLLSEIIPFHIAIILVVISSIIGAYISKNKKETQVSITNAIVEDNILSPYYIRADVEYTVDGIVYKESNKPVYKSDYKHRTLAMLPELNNKVIPMKYNSKNPKILYIL